MGKKRGPRSKRRRALIHQLGGKRGWACHYCARPLSYDGPPHLRPTLDHIVPLSEGGTNHFTNLTMACFRCNHRKGAEPADLRRLRRGVQHDGTLRAAGGAGGM